MTLHLDLNGFNGATDDELLRRVPQDVLDYYQALPLAVEEGRVTVVTPHPDNRVAIQVLARLLEAEIVPVSVSESAVSAAIERRCPVHPLPRRVVSWSDEDGWRKQVQATAALYAGLLGTPVTHLAENISSEVLHGLHLLSEDALLVCHTDNLTALGALMQRIPAPLLLVGGEPRLPRRVLVALRGFGSDHATLRQARPLFAAEQADVTILPLTHDDGPQPGGPLATVAPDRLHLAECLHGMDACSVVVRLRAGGPAEQIIAELSAANYDLVVIAAEARGEFVLKTLEKVEAAGILTTQPLLIIRPPAGVFELSGQRNDQTEAT